LSLSWARLIQSLPPHLTPWRSIVIVFSRLCLGLQVVSSLRFPHPIPVYTSSLTRMCYMPCPSHSHFNHPNNIGWAVQIIKFLIMESSLLPSYLVPLRPKYSPQHPIYVDSKVKR
jgi:hypothetical protein